MAPVTARFLALGVVVGARVEGHSRKLPPRAVEEAVGVLLDRSALQGERVVSIARVLFATSLAVRSWWVWRERGADDDVLRGWVFFPAIAVMIVFSVVPWLSARFRPRIPVLVHGSVALDSVVAFAALLTNPLWPWRATSAWSTCRTSPGSPC